MSREEFLEILNIQLQGEIPSNEISQHLAYYHNFIEQKIRQGQSEADILEELGDPRLIAKTLIDTEDVPNVRGYRQDYAYSAEEAKDQTSAQEDSVQKSSQQEGSQWEAFQWENFQEEDPEQEPSQQESFQQESFQQEPFQQEPFQQKSPRPDGVHWLDTSTWYGKLAVIVGAVLIAVFLFLIIGALLPVAAALVIVAILFSWINRRR